MRISRLKARLTRSDSRVECVDRQLAGNGWKMLAVHEWGCLGLWGCQHGGRGISIRHANCLGKRHVSKMFFLSLIAHTLALLEDLWRELSKSSAPPGRSPRKPKGILFDCGKKFARWSPSRRARRRPIVPEDSCNRRSRGSWWMPLSTFSSPYREGGWKMRFTRRTKKRGAPFGDIGTKLGENRLALRSRVSGKR